MNRDERGRLPPERGSPANLDAEEGLLACCILDERGEVMAACIEAKIQPDYFFKPSHQSVYQGLLLTKGPIDEIIFCDVLDKAGLLESVGGHAELNRITNRVETTSHFRHWLEIVREKALFRKFISAGTSLVEKAYSGHFDADALLSYQSEQFAALFDLLKQDGDAPKQKSAAQQRKVDKLLKRAHLHAFDLSNPPPPEVPIMWLNGCEVAWRNNLTVFLAQKKSAKSSTQAAAIGSMMGARGRDYLGFEGQNPGSQSVIHFDTEQSPSDHHALVKRTLRRAGLDSPPHWFQSIHLRPFPINERREIVRELALRHYSRHGLSAIILDGGADMVSSVNDEAAAVDFLTELAGLMDETKCAVIASIHQNEQPTGKFAAKNSRARGHLGAEFERKASMTLELTKERNQTTGKEEVTISAKDARHGVPVSSVIGWSDEHAMHVTISKPTVQPVDPKTFKKRRELAELCAELFQSPDSLEQAKPMSHSELCANIVRIKGCADSTAGTKVKDMLALGIVEVIPCSQMYRPATESVEL